jgi:dTDP-4-dehydrorhamnose reductase
VYRQLKPLFRRTEFEIQDDVAATSKTIRLEADSSSWSLPESDFYIVWAGETSLERCEQKPKETYFVNVTQTKILIDLLIRRGGRVIFPSTNLVFSGHKPFEASESITNPRGNYAKFKTEIEEWLLTEYPDRARILRMTKVWDKQAPFILRWERERINRERIRVSTNRLISPTHPVSVMLNINHIIQNWEMQTPRIIQTGSNFEISHHQLALKFYNADEYVLSLLDPVTEITHNSTGFIHNSLQPTYAEFVLSEEVFMKSFKDR